MGNGSKKPEPKPKGEKGQRAKGQPTDPLKKNLCSIFSAHGYGKAGFSIGDGLAGTVEVTFTQKDISAFVGVGAGGGTSFYFNGGLSESASTGSPAGFRTFVTATASLPFVPIGGNLDFSGGSDGLDFSAGGGTAEGASVVAGFGVNVTLVDGDPAKICLQ